MSARTRTFVSLLAYLGFAYVVFLLGSIHVDQPARFATYLALAAITSLFQARQSGVAVSLSLNLPVLLIAIVDLSRPEAVAVGCLAALVQCSHFCQSTIYLRCVCDTAQSGAILMDTIRISRWK